MKWFEKVKRKFKKDQEKGSRKKVLEELFNDFNSSRFEVYKFNFFRGIFFGLGSVLGGTVVITMLIWTLNVTGNLVPGVAGFVDNVVSLMREAKQ